MYVGDEIVCNGVTMENFTAVANYVKMNLDGYSLPGLVWANECLPQFFLGNESEFGFGELIPAGLDAISFDAYELVNRSESTGR